jgi:hypothetical protein
MKIEKLTDIMFISIEDTDGPYDNYSDQLDCMEVHANERGFFRYDQRPSLVTYLEQTDGKGKIQFYSKAALEKLNSKPKITTIKKGTRHLESPKPKCKR